MRPVQPMSSNVKTDSVWNPGSDVTSKQTVSTALMNKTAQVNHFTSDGDKDTVSKKEGRLRAVYFPSFYALFPWANLK